MPLAMELVMPLVVGLVMPLAMGLVVLPAAVGGRDDDDEVGRAPVAAGLGIWLGPEAAEPEGAVEELVGAEPAAGAVTVPVPAGVVAGDDREPLLGTGPGPGPAGIWAAGVDEVWLGAAGTGGLEESVAAARGENARSRGIGGRPGCTCRVGGKLGRLLRRGTHTRGGRGLYGACTAALDAAGAVEDALSDHTGCRVRSTCRDRSRTASAAAGRNESLRRRVGIRGQRSCGIAGSPMLGRGGAQFRTRGTTVRLRGDRGLGRWRGDSGPAGDCSVPWPGVTPSGETSVFVVFHDCDRCA